MIMLYVLMKVILFGLIEFIIRKKIKFYNNINNII